MAYPLPPWLGPVNPAPYFQQGVSQGASIAEAQNRTELAIQEMTLRREAQQRAQEAQNLAAARTVQDMQAQQQQMAEQARQAALKWQGQQEYGALVGQGVPPEEAFARTASKMIPGQLGQFIARTAEQKSISQRAQAAEQDRLKRLNEKELFDREKFEFEKEKFYTKPPPLGSSKTPEQQAKEKNIDLKIRGINAEITKAASGMMGPEDKQTQKVIDQLELERDTLMKEREDMYKNASYPLPSNVVSNMVSQNPFLAPQMNTAPVTNALKVLRIYQKE